MATTRKSTASNARVLKSTVVDTPQQEEASFNFGDFAASLGLPSGKRVIVSFIAAILIAGTTLYLGMHLSMYLAVGAALLTGSSFIAFLCMFLGYALSILASVVVGGKVQSFILNGDIDRTYEAAKSKVTGWFGSARNMVSRSAA